jgi:hypothetical protein
VLGIVLIIDTHETGLQVDANLRNEILIPDDTATTIESDEDDFVEGVPYNVCFGLVGAYSVLPMFLCML